MRRNLNHKGIRVNKTNNKTRLLERVRNMFLLVLAGVGCLPLAAQSLRDTNSAPDTFSVNSGYFSPDLANNMDYAQFLVDEARLEERLALWGAERMQTTAPWRAVYLVGTNIFNYFTLLRLSYHEWGHASRIVALGGTARFSNCLNVNGNDWCDAPRDFFGYAQSQFFHFAGGGITKPSGNINFNQESGNAILNIVTGAGVNNEMLVADKLNEQHFVRGTGNIFSQWTQWGQLAIVNYGPAHSGDMANVASYYRSSGVDRQIQENDLRNINNLSLLSGSTVTAFKASYDYIANGKYNVKPWTIGGFLVPNQYNYLSSRGITRKWVSGYEWNDSTKLLGSYEYVVRGDNFSEPGLGIYKNFGDWDMLMKVSGTSLAWANMETAVSKRMDAHWKWTVTANLWDSRSLLGERNTLDFTKNKTHQISVGVAYEY